MRNIVSLSEHEMKIHLFNAAALYSKYVDTDLLFIYRQPKNKQYDFYEVHFGKENFMHLAGVKSKILSATEFYQKCLENKITRQDCTPCHSVMNMYSKISILESLLDFKHCKLYKIGLKNLITKDNDFEIATGNSMGLIGYDRRVTKAGTNLIDDSKLAVPTTLLNEHIKNYCQYPEKIMFVLQKKSDELKYENILYEIKKCLFFEERENFSMDILKRCRNELLS